MATCELCTRPTDVILCRGCTDQLAGELRTVPWLVEQLTIVLTRQTRAGDRNGPRGSERPLPFDLNASIDLESMRDGMAHWAAKVAAQRQITVDAAREPKALALWLLRWMGAVAQHADAAELHGDILDLARAARRTVDLAPELRYVGPCEDCNEDLYAGMHARTITCGTAGCEAEYPIEARRAWLREQAEDQLRTASELSRELPWIAGVTITSKVIGMWAVRGKLTRYLPHPLDDRQAKRFRVGEVIDLARTVASEQAVRTVSGAA